MVFHHDLNTRLKQPSDPQITETKMNRFTFNIWGNKEQDLLTKLENQNERV